MSKCKKLLSLLISVTLIVFPAGLVEAKGGPGNNGAAPGKAKNVNVQQMVVEEENIAEDDTKDKNKGQGKPDKDKEKGKVEKNKEENKGDKQNKENNRERNKEKKASKVIKNQRALLPVNAINNGFGADFTLDETTNLLVVEKDGKQIQIDLENKVALVNGNTVSLTKGKSTRARLVISPGLLNRLFSQIESDTEDEIIDPEDENTEDGTTEDGTTEDGTTEDGTTEDGTTEDGTTEDGTTEDGTTEDGSTGTAEDETTPAEETSEGNNP